VITQKQWALNNLTAWFSHFTLISLYLKWNCIIIPRLNRIFYIIFFRNGYLWIFLEDCWGHLPLVVLHICHQPTWKEILLLQKTVNLNSKDQQFNQYQQLQNVPLNSLITRKTMTYTNENPGPDYGQAQKCGRVKPVNRIISPLLIIGSSIAC